MCPAYPRTLELLSLPEASVEMKSYVMLADTDPHWGGGGELTCPSCGPGGSPTQPNPVAVILYGIYHFSFPLSREPHEELVVPAACTFVPKAAWPGSWHLNHKQLIHLLYERVNKQIKRSKGGGSYVTVKRVQAF